jgi:hypothetical protein
MGRVFFNTRMNLDTDTMTNTTAYSMTEADSGKTFIVSGGAQAITLLPAADVPEGWNCRFMNGASPSGDKTLSSGSTMIHGTCQDAGNGAGCGTDGTVVSNIIIEAAGQAGSFLDLFSDGTLYYFHANASQDTAYTTT